MPLAACKHGLRRRIQQRPRAMRLRAVHAGAHGEAEQAVAAAQMVVEEGERRAHGEAVQPERDLGELHRHRVLVHAVNAALEHHALHDMAVVQPRPVHLPPAWLFGIVEHGAADGSSMRAASGDT